MLPLRSRGQSWGLVEIYADDRTLRPAEIELAITTVDRVGELARGARERRRARLIAAAGTGHVGLGREAPG